MTRKGISGPGQNSRPDRQQGQALLEFALVISFLFLLIFAIIDFSRVFFGYATMSNGVREGARYAIVHPNDNAGIEEAARAMMFVIGAPVEVTVSFPDTDGGGGPCHSRECRVVVTATSNFDVWTPVVPTLQLVAHATMHIE
jgi:Flp pilus assembly protein TadG